MKSSLNTTKVAWAQPILGNNGNLMYMAPLLDGLNTKCKSFHVFTAQYGGDTNNTEYKITSNDSLKTLERNTNGLYPSGIRIIGPSLFISILKYRPQLLILNEFSLLTFYGVLVKLLRPSTKILLIVESRPYSLGGGALTTIKTLVRRLLCKTANKILTNNDIGKEYLISELGVPYKKIISKPYLVSDMTTTISDELIDKLNNRKHINSNPVQFIYVGQLIERKGLQQALLAASTLVSHGCTNFIINIIGDGPYRATLEETTSKLNIKKHVVFHGKKPYQALVQEYINSDVLLFPTLSDYRALAPFEALSMGLPLLASVRDGGISETVIDGENGYSFVPSDTDKLADLMKIFINQPERIEQFSKKSLEIAKSYTISSALKNIESACNATLQS